MYYIYIWANYNDLTATSLESWIIRGIIPKWPYFRLVNYYNLPRYILFKQLFSRVSKVGHEECMLIALMTLTGFNKFTGTTTGCLLRK